MDGVIAMLDDLVQTGQTSGRLLGMLHVLIGRRLHKADGTVLTAGLTWRELSVILKQARWDKDAVREIGVDPNTLPPRDRQRFWLQAIALAKIDSPAARVEGDRFAELLEGRGYKVDPPRRT